MLLSCVFFAWASRAHTRTHHISSQICLVVFSIGDTIFNLLFLLGDLFLQLFMVVFPPFDFGCGKLLVRKFLSFSFVILHPEVLHPTRYFNTKCIIKSAPKLFFSPDLQADCNTNSSFQAGCCAICLVFGSFSQNGKIHRLVYLCIKRME